jgi:pilus assembly protein CpaF
MGSALKKSCILTGFTGAKGGSGTTTLCSLLGRNLVKNTGLRLALIDTQPSPFSSLPSALGIQPATRHLLQLEPYFDKITTKILENAFPRSPEGIAYIPLRLNDGEDFNLRKGIDALRAIQPHFDAIWVDLSPFPPDQVLALADDFNSIVLISTVEPSSLAALKIWEKRILALHLDLSRFQLLLNQSRPDTSGNLTDLSIAKSFSSLGTAPYLGENLSLTLWEKKGFPPTLDKPLSALTDKLSDLHQASQSTGPAQKQSGTDATTEPIEMEDIHRLHMSLLDQLRRQGLMEEGKTGGDNLRNRLEPRAREILNQLLAESPYRSREIRQRVMDEVLDLAFGLGPLERLLQNEEITEVMVNGPDRVYAEKKGLLEPSDTRFMDDQQLRTVIERILAPIGRRIDESQPYVDGRLADGSRINAVIPPLSLNGPVLTIRKFSKKKLTVEDLIHFGSLTREAADFLGACVRARKNIVVSGGTGSGKTTLLNVLSNFIPENERIVTIEDSAELKLSQDHVVRLEARPANLEGKGQVTIRDLVINSLRMRPDRIVVGEVRGAEALDMLQAMNTGHDGSLTTGHANTPRDILSRLETMCLFAGLDLPLKAIREQIARAVHLIVQQSRLPGGKRSVTHITALQGMEGDVVMLQDLFLFEEGKGLMRGNFAPAFIDDLRRIGYQWPGHET